MGSNTQIVIKFVEANKNVVVAFAAQNKLIEMSADDVKDRVGYRTKNCRRLFERAYSA